MWNFTHSFLSDFSVGVSSGLGSKVTASARVLIYIVKRQHFARPGQYPSGVRRAARQSPSPA